MEAGHDADEGLLSLPSPALTLVICFAGPSAARRLACVSTRARRLVSNDSDEAWRAFAVLRWGMHVPAKAEVPSSCWRTYYTHRCSRWRCPASPLGLFQEAVGTDPWKMVASCILRSRTGGGAVIGETVAAFFAAYPTPSAVVDADMSDMAAMLFPLGLNRERTIKRTAAGFLSADFTGHAVSHLFGCGALAEDSHAVFCAGDAARISRSTSADRNVRAYATWAVRTDAAAAALAASKTELVGATGGSATAASGAGAGASTAAASKSAAGVGARKAAKSAGTSGSESSCSDDDDEDEDDAPAVGGAGAMPRKPKKQRASRSSAAAAAGAPTSTELAARGRAVTPLAEKKNVGEASSTSHSARSLPRSAKHAASASATGTASSSGGSGGAAAATSSKAKAAAAGKHKRHVSDSDVRPAAPAAASADPGSSRRRSTRTASAAAHAAVEKTGATAPAEAHDDAAAAVGRKRRRSGSAPAGAGRK